MFTRIVLAYNHTPRAQRALNAAVQIAREDGAELIAVAVERSLVLSGESITEVRAVHAARERACTGWLSSALAYADEHDVPLRTEIRIGRVARQLAAAAAAHRADLLILGRSDQDVIRRRLRRTTADKVSRHARCPVMTIP
jgi:nucleotide-binding universal stress UspA family protein